MAKKIDNLQARIEYAQEKRDRQRAYWRKQDRKERSERRSGVLNVIFVILLLFALIGVLSNRELLTFKGFLEFLKTCPALPMDFLQINLEGTIPVLSFLGTLVNAITFILTCIVNALTIILWFLRALFL